MKGKNLGMGLHRDWAESRRASRSRMRSSRVRGEVATVGRAFTERAASHHRSCNRNYQVRVGGLKRKVLILQTGQGIGKIRADRWLVGKDG